MRGEKDILTNSMYVIIWNILCIYLYIQRKRHDYGTRWVAVAVNTVPMLRIDEHIFISSEEMSDYRFSSRSLRHTRLFFCQRLQPMSHSIFNRTRPNFAMLCLFACLLAMPYLASAFLHPFHAPTRCSRITQQPVVTTNSKPDTFLSAYYVSPSEDDEEMIRTILGPMGSQKPRPSGRSIIILSDTTGVTAKSAVEKSLIQFNGCDERFLSAEDEDEDADPCELMQKTVYPFIKNKNELLPIIEKAAMRRSLVVSTFADPEMRDSVAELCDEAGLSHVDLLGPIFDAMGTFFNRKPLGMAGPGTRRQGRRELTELYYSQVDAIEFTLKADDGMAPWLLKEADVILVGVSRTGKTPLSVYLAQSLGLKVSNVPLVLELPPPKELLEENIDPRRVFCLTLNPIDLQRIRENRIEKELEKLPDKRSTYSEWDYLQKDLANARRLAEKYGYTEIDVTGRAVEETASMISSMLNERFSTGV